MDHSTNKHTADKMQLIERCRKRAAEEETPLREIFDDVCRTSVSVAQNESFDEVENSTYKRRRTALPMLPNNPESGGSAIENTRYATVGVSTFFRGQVSSGGDDTALLFATDTQLQLPITALLALFSCLAFSVAP